MGPLKKGQRIIDRFEGPKVHTVYDGTIACTICDNKGHTQWVEISNYLYVPNGHERLISPQHWA